MQSNAQPDRPIPNVRIRRKEGARGFYHENRVVDEGEDILVPPDIARTLIDIGKAEYV